MNREAVIIGAGLAGSEAAYQLAERGIKVKLYEMRPIKSTEAHKTENFAELVCSNSLGGDHLGNASGLMKEELRRMGSLLVKIADETRVPAGQALAVDREGFSGKITEILKNHPNIEIINEEVTEIPQDKIVLIASGPLTSLAVDREGFSGKITEILKNHPNIEIINEEVTEIPQDKIVLIASGPLTSEVLSKKIQELTHADYLYFYDAAAPIVTLESIDMDKVYFQSRYDPLTSEVLSKKIQELTHADYLYFYDAAAPIVTLESIDMDKVYFQSRYDKGDGEYINCPMNEEEYKNFYENLITAERAPLKKFEEEKLFEGCMPVERIAGRGEKTLLFGPLKPKGLTNPRTGKRDYAVVQLRQDDKDGRLYNIVGFQTNLKFGEQKRVFSMIPGLENAEFIRYGVMHRNTFINSTKLLTPIKFIFSLVMTRETENI